MSGMAKFFIYRHYIIMINLKTRTLPQNLVDVLADFKGSGAFRVNEKLRGIVKEPLTKSERAIVEGFQVLPRETLQEDAFVYRGVMDSYDFLPLEALKPGAVFSEKGFTSVSPFDVTALLFKGLRGILERIRLPQGTKVIDIDSLLEANRPELLSKAHPKHELVLLPNQNFRVLDFSDSDYIDSESITHSLRENGHLGLFNMELL